MNNTNENNNGNELARYLLKIKNILILITLLIIYLWQKPLLDTIFYKGFSIVYPFILGCGIAFILNVPMSFIENKLFSKARIESSKFKFLKQISRPVSLFLTIIFFILLVTVLLVIVFPQLYSTVQSLESSSVTFFTTIDNFKNQLIKDFPELANLAGLNDISLNNTLQSALNIVLATVENILGSLVVVVNSITSGVTSGVIGFVFSIYILLQKEKLKVQFSKIFYAIMSKKAANKSIEICSLSYNVFSKFLTGQCTECVILGLMFIVVLSVFNMPFAFLIGVLIGFAALIPILGAFIGCGIGAFLILIESPSKVLTFLVVFLIIQQVEGNLIYPRVVGGSVGLPSMWVLVAVTIGGNLMGVTGMLVFIPLSAISYILFREFVYNRLNEKGITIEDSSE